MPGLLGRAAFVLRSDRGRGRMNRLRLERIPLQVQRVLRVIAVGLVVSNWVFLLRYLR